MCLYQSTFCSRCFRVVVLIASVRFALTMSCQVGVASVSSCDLLFQHGFPNAVLFFFVVASPLLLQSQEVYASCVAAVLAQYKQRIATMATPQAGLHPVKLKCEFQGRFVFSEVSCRHVYVLVCIALFLCVHIITSFL